MICALWGPEKSWKTTMALTFPKPLYHFDLDVGGFDRAAWRLDTNDIESKSYPTPIQLEKLMGQQKEGPTIRFPKRVIGIKEVWQQIVMDFVAAVNRPEIKTIVIDSATQLWTIDHRGYLQELQERQLQKFLFDKEGKRITNRTEDNFDPNEFRERLQPIEYAEPNDRMRTLIYTARSFGKHLVLTHYPRDVYKQRVTDRGIEDYKSGDIEPDGFKDTQKLVDIVIWVETSEQDVVINGKKSGKQTVVRATITKCGLEGLGTAAMGLYVEPSYDGILKLQEAMRG
jgi:hypothetical protein